MGNLCDYLGVAIILRSSLALPKLKMKNVFFHVEVLGDARVLFSVFPQSVPSRKRGVID